MKDLQELVLQLLIVAQSYTGYHLPAERPEVRFVPQAELQAAACEGPCKILGWFPPGRTIFLDERLDPLEDVRARGILLHEITHFLQQGAGAYEDGMACRNWALREYEAYRVQARWLREQGTRLGAYPGGGRAPWSVACGPEDDEDSDP